MARRAVPLTATALSLALLALVLGPVAVLLAQPGAVGTAPDGAALRFTVLQATLSAAASVALAVPVARALARRRFRGRGVVIALLGAPFLLPVIVAVLGLLAVFGRAGWVKAALEALGLPAIAIYGLHGVVLAHVFLNMPLAVRMILSGWQAIPAERFRLAASLGFGPGETLRHLELPMLRAVLPGVALVIFTVCLSSFAVALTLGGGPGATTVELAIYQALRFQFDLPAAARLALLQCALCATAFLIASRLTLPQAFGAGLDRSGGPPAPGGWHRIADASAIALCLAFIVMPLAAIALRGLPGLAALPPPVWQAAARSLAVALPATALTVTLALTLALAHARGGRLPAIAATLPLAVSSLVLGTGLFLALRPVIPPATLALPVTVAVNALLALPFAFRILAPEATALHRDWHRLTQSLALSPVARLRWIVLPRLARPLGFAAGLSAALAMGDLGVIALFAADNSATLPLAIHRLMGAYRMDDAAAAALLLVSLSLALFWAFDRAGRHAAP
ncbi:MAG: thiamine/thiamine pyrophosphate ABC transporter permease ThiP [Gemmobacter sp.]